MTPLLHYTTPPFYCKYFCKRVCPILTAAEGYILGVGAKIFTIAGPVIMYGTVASVIYGFIYWITTLF
ncbi:MAG: SpoVA/SpoVAEb family sporulation membrane protein [Clostridia bacterium]|nr:SpoVA/SpoVAEb family sporulation membrane protein [Clostridia bacterium]